jgi:hypothetical protein
MTSSVASDPRERMPDPSIPSWDLSAPLNGTWTLLREVRTIQDKISGRGIPWLSRRRTGVRHKHLSGSCQARLHSPLRRGPGATTWPAARDVSQSAEPDVRPRGRAISAFIVEIARRLTALQTGDVPTQHLMCPVHSDGRRRPDQVVPVQSSSGEYAPTTARA